MAAYKEKSLKFNTEEFEKMRNKLKETSDELDTLKNKLVSSSDGLKEKWKTPAGEKFLATIGDDFLVKVDNYKKIINAIDELLKVAEDNYALVEAETAKLKF